MPPPKDPKKREEYLQKQRRPRPSMQGERNPMFGKIGEKSPLYGRHPSEEILAKMRKPKSEEAKQHMRESKSEEHKANQSISMKKYIRKHPNCRTFNNSPSWKGGKSYFKLNGELKHRNVVYKELFEKQNGVCAICGKEETRKLNGNICRLCIDHDHKTGEVRGLLCQRCNTKLGHLEDIEFIVKAKLYLEERG